MKTRTGQIGLALTLLSIAALGVSLWWLMLTLRERNVTTMRTVAQFEPLELEVDGHPFSVERIPPIGEDEPGTAPVLRLSWRGNTHDFAMGPSETPLEFGLKRWGHWFGVLLLADGAATEEEFERLWQEGGPDAYFVAAALYPAPGYEDGWEYVRRQEWQYEFALMRLDGQDDEALEITRKPYEQVDALHLPGRYTDEEFLPTEEERERDLWQYYAMEAVTPAPQLRGRNKRIDTLVDEMGLAWPAAGLSALGAVIGVLLIGLGARSR